MSFETIMELGEKKLLIYTAISYFLIYITLQYFGVSSNMIADYMLYITVIGISLFGLGFINWFFDEQNKILESRCVMNANLIKRGIKERI